MWQAKFIKCILDFSEEVIKDYTMYKMIWLVLNKHFYRLRQITDNSVVTWGCKPDLSYCISSRDMVNSK